jgi:hypothetical protein
MNNSRKDSYRKKEERKVAKIIVKILNKGDTVISVTERMIAVQRKNGEVDIIPLIFDEFRNPPRIDIENIITISYGKNSIETVIEGDNGDIKVTTF